jgi:hypothetical protein
MPVTSNDIANRAILMVGDNQPPVTGVAPTFDDSTAGQALQYLYAPCVAMVQRQFEWDASRNTVSLTLSGNAAPAGWIYEYLYPTNGIEVWQLQPATLGDPNNPLPQNWIVANALVSGTQRKVIQSNLINAVAIYNNNPSEDTWDSLFSESVVRLLASELAIAIAGKPETSQLGLESGSAFLNVAKGRDG